MVMARCEVKEAARAAPHLSVCPKALAGLREIAPADIEGRSQPRLPAVDRTVAQPMPQR
jgi:hypothetical protein